MHDSRLTGLNQSYTFDVRTETTAPHLSGSIVRQRLGTHRTNLTAKYKCWEVKAQDVTEHRAWEGDRITAEFQDGEDAIDLYHF